MTLAVVAKSAKLTSMFALGGGAMDDGYGYLVLGCVNLAYFNPAYVASPREF